MSGEKVVEMSRAIFEKKWLSKYSAIFSGRGINERPFKNKDWDSFIIGSPAFFLGQETSSLSESQRNHAQIYTALERSIEACGDREMVGFLQHGPHENPSIFFAPHVSGSVVRTMRLLAVDGFDLHVFSISCRWGLAVSWEEEVAVIGGDAPFALSFVNSASASILKKEIVRTLEPLENFSAETAYWASQLRSTTKLP